MNNVFTAIQNRDGEALSRMSGYEHQYTNNDNVVNMSAERLVDALFKQLKQLFPAAVVTNLKTPEQEVAAKQQWIAAFAEGGIRTREQVSAGMRHARASDSPFWPSPGQFIKWCKDSKMVLGVTIDDVMTEFHRYSKEKSLYPGGPERFPWRHPVMYWVVCDNGVTTTFPYTFRIFQKSDLVVQVVDLDENIAVLALDTDYTVTGAGGYNGGNVIVSKALANGHKISISRELPVTQETDLRNQGGFVE